MSRREELINRRVKVGHTQESLAFALGVAPTTVSAWERGERNPGPRKRPHLAEKLDIDIDELDRLLNGGDTELDGLEVLTWLTHYESVVHRAGKLQKVELAVIPGLLQTRDYIEALERMSGVTNNERRIVDAVRRRLSRQQVLDRDPDPLHVTVLITEGILRDRVGTPQIMADQLDHLIELAQRATIEIRILGPGRAPTAISGFELLTRPTGRNPFLACTFDVGGVRYQEDPDVVRKFIDRFANLTTDSLNADETLHRIEHIQRTHHR
jgi:transcriptional regulator with XRE-family HTH domain